MHMCILTYFQHTQTYKESCLMYNNVRQFYNIVVCCVLKADACAYKHVNNKLNNLSLTDFSHYYMNELKYLSLK